MGQNATTPNGGGRTENAEMREWHHILDKTVKERKADMLKRKDEVRWEQQKMSWQMRKGAGKIPELQKSRDQRQTDIIQSHDWIPSLIDISYS